jgi:hypothetical protein
MVANYVCSLPNTPIFDELHQSLRVQRVEVKDRDLVVFEIPEPIRSTMNSDSLDAQTVHWLREEFGVSHGGFTVILVGKDGGIKLRRQSQTRPPDILP